MQAIRNRPLVDKAEQNVRHMLYIPYSFSPASFFNQKVWDSDSKSGKNSGKLRDWRAGGKSRYYYKGGANNASIVLMCVFTKRYAMDAMMSGYRFLYNWMILTRKLSGWRERCIITIIRGISQLLVTIDLPLYTDYCGLIHLDTNF